MTPCASILLLYLCGCGLRGEERVALRPQVAAASTWQDPNHERAIDSNQTPVQAELPTIQLLGAVNETVAFQLVLTGTPEVRQGLSVSIEEFVSSDGRIAPDQVQVYRRRPVRVDRYPNWYLRSIGPQAPREILDALVPINAPIGGQPFTLKTGESAVLWIDIRVPFVAEPAVYRGGVLVLDAFGNNLRVPVELEVRDVFLSPQDAIPIIAPVQLRPLIAAHTELDPENLRLILDDAEARNLLTDTFRLLHRHGLSPMTTDVLPLMRQDLDGAVHLDWSAYDRFCGPLIDGTAFGDRRPAHHWPLPISDDFPDPTQYEGIASQAYAGVLTAQLAETIDHFESQDWLKRAYVDFGPSVDVNPGAEAVGRVRRLAELCRSVDKRVPIVSYLSPQSMAPFGWFDHHHEDLTDIISIWATPARYQQGGALARLQQAGLHTWLFPDRPPFSGSIAVEAPEIHARSLPWQAFLQGHSAIFLSEMTNWPQGLLDFSLATDQKPTDSWLVYPGKPFGLNRPVPSVRLKQLQQGIQDYQRLRALAEHGRAETAKRLISGSLIKAVGIDACGDNYQDGLFDRRIEDSQAWELARRILDDELSAVLRGDSSMSDNRGADHATWGKFLAATRSIAVWPESARLMVDTRRRQSGYLIAYDVAIRSELRTPLEGRLRFGPLPPGVKSVSDVIRVGPVPEMGLVRKKIIAGLPALPSANLNGHWPQPIVFDAGASGLVEFSATTSLVRCPRSPHPITVDGLLYDWTPQAFNTAADFRVIAAYHGFGEDRPPAAGQTIVYFSHDDQFLYIGVHAASPKKEDDERTDSSRFRNYVEYEDLMPMGEDLVEILIDPTNAGTVSGDLYHVVVKSTGNPIFERGIGTMPPIGQIQPWPDIPPQCEVAKTEDGWSAEIAIPLSAFGDAAYNSVWGINLARLEPQAGEYSDWARAPRYCYDPRTLGNLVWQTP